MTKQELLEKAMHVVMHLSAYEPDKAIDLLTFYAMEMGRLYRESEYDVRIEDVCRVYDLWAEVVLVLRGREDSR